MATANVDQGPIKKPRDVKYLAFEGGGGRGVVYVGALLAMESLVSPELPSLQMRPHPLQLLGLSGSSAGAITAFFVALGVKASELAKILSKAETFNGFYDGPENAKLRMVRRDKFSPGRPVVFAARADPKTGQSSGPAKTDTKNGQPPVRRDKREVGPDEQAMWTLQIDEFPFRIFSPASIAAGVAAGVGGVGGALLGGPGALAGALPALAIVAGLVSHLAKAIPESVLKDLAQSHEPYAPLLNVLTKNDDVFNKYLYNLLFDRGLFPGFNMRNFLRDQLAERLSGDDYAGKSPRERREIADRMTFEQFDRMVGLDFTVTGTNITTGRPQYFSCLKTPKFPVVNAVCISSAIPFVFKPVLTLDCDRVDDGYWVNGGVITNLPIHAFDENPPGPLNPSIVSLRLEDLPQLPEPHFPEDVPQLPGDLTEAQKKNLTDRQRQAKKEADKALKAAGKTDLSFGSIIFAHLADVFNSFFYSSEEGQIRTPDERKRTLSLDTTGLTLLEFAPPGEISGPLIREAFDHVYQYFGLDPPAEGSSVRSELERMIGLFPPSRSPARASPPRIPQIPPPRV